MSKQKLLISASSKFIAGLILMGLVLFLPAGTWNYSNAWLFLGLLFIPMLILGVVLFVKAPELLEKRLQSKEKESTQKGVVAVSGLMFIGSFVLAGLDFRFGCLGSNGCGNCFTGILWHVRRGHAGKCLSFQNSGSAGKPEGY